uniref:C2H2-type domain-containing protein n=1 Tax=Peronospora matthiolae TaxID=2874970 RepID=A0AAV1UTY4_9STRA
MQESRVKSRPKCAKKTSSSAPKLHATSTGKVARFKEEKHLKIETRDLGHSEVAPGAEKGSSASKKRRRRLAAEIDRKYKCCFAACQKAYGSEGSLIHHQKLKHPEQVDRREKESQVGTLLLPLHRNVMIRPATPLMAIANHSRLLPGKQSTNAGIHMPIAPSSDAPSAAKASRRSVRSRSNSEPAAFFNDKSNARVSLTRTKLMDKACPKFSRKPRRGCTTSQAFKTKGTARSTKLRSKSESLTEMNPMYQLDEIRLSMFDRSDDMSNDPEPDLLLSSVIPSAENGPFEWPGTTISDAESYMTVPSSDEQAIDSDILSVLATCDTGDPSVSQLGGVPPPTSPFLPSLEFGELENTEMLSVGSECFQIAEDAALPTQLSQQLITNEAEVDLGIDALSVLGNDWSNTVLLSNHLEKMSMAPGDSPPPSTAPMFGNEVLSGGIKERVRSASDPVLAAASVYPQLHHVLSMPLDLASARSSGQLTSYRKLGGHKDTDFQQWFSCSAAKVAKANDGDTYQMLWLPSEHDFAGSSMQQQSSDELDQLLQYDDTIGCKYAGVFADDIEVNDALDDTERYQRDIDEAPEGWNE